MTERYNRDVLMLITGQSYFYDLEHYNYWAKEVLGGTGGHKYAIDALNEICGLAGAEQGHVYNITALNALAVAYGGVGGHAYEYDALVEVQNGSLLSLPVFSSPNTFSAAENQTAVGPAVASPVDSYSIVAGGDGASFEIGETSGVITFKSAPDYEDKNSYTLTVRATKGGNYTDQNITVNVTNVNEQPAAPSNLVLTVVSDTEIDLSWTDNSNNEQSFKVERSADNGSTYTEIASVNAGTTTYNNTGLTAATKYYYRVRAYNGGEYSSYCTAVYATTRDADAQAFVTAASLTDATQISAVDTLTKALKTANIWTKMKAVYPFIGGSATTHKFNLKDPRDLDAAYRIAFSTGWTHDANGITPNGINAYGEIVYTIPTTNYLIGIYSRTDNAKQAGDIGQPSGGAASAHMYLKYQNGTSETYFRPYSSYGFNVGNSQGFFYESYYGSTVVYGKNNSPSTDTYTSNIAQLTKVYIGGKTPSSTEYNNRNYAFAIISEGLTSTEITNLYSAVQAYQTTLGRQV